tara:strand:- start:29 stop:604 length:576 start_codon:yes stop_codon:yes gene_type:complete
MKRLLLIPFLFLLVGFGGKPNQWPTSWKEFDMPKLINIHGAFDIPSKEAKPYMTVIFTDSIEEACKEFKKAEKLQELFEEKKKASWNRYSSLWKKGEVSEYREFAKMEFNATVDALWPRDAKLVSTAVEVLRQADYPDWKLYSRYTNAGVGDLWRKRILTKKEDIHPSNKNNKYIINGESEARDVCNALAP